MNFLFQNTPLRYLTQSIWRDEGFSFFMAKENIFQIILNSINDFNPPLYYILLHFWLRIFGESDIALRMMSFVFFIVTVYYIFLLSKTIFSEKFAFWVALFSFFNPMLLYYAFEMRMYSLFALFTVMSLYYFVGKRWRAYIIVGTLGMYTHSFFSLIILAYLFYLFVIKQFKRKIVLRTITPLLLFIPWIPFLIYQFMESKNSWIFPVDIQLIKSALGNLFVAYEGTPGGLWGKTFYLSLVILLLVVFSIKKNKKYGLLFGSLIFIPLFIILSYSFFKKPIYVNRYLIFVTIGEIFAISLAFWSIRSRVIRYALMTTSLLLVIYINVYASVRAHKKVDFRSTIEEIRRLSKEEDYVYAISPIVYFESAFYYPNRENVYIYNPQNIPIPKYIGTSVISPSRSALDFPDAPSRVFLVKEDGSFETIISSLPTQQ